MSFAADIARFAELANQDLDKTIRAVRLQAVELVIEKMPVDTGQAKGSLFFTTGQPSQQVTGSPDRTGATALSRAAGVVGRDLEQPFFITSNLPYVSLLEFGGYSQGPYSTGKTNAQGFSIQAPMGMFRISAQQLADGISRTVRNAVR